MAPGARFDCAAHTSGYCGSRIKGLDWKRFRSIWPLDVTSNIAFFKPWWKLQCWALWCSLPRLYSIFPKVLGISFKSWIKLRQSIWWATTMRIFIGVAVGPWLGQEITNTWRLPCRLSEVKPCSFFPLFEILTYAVQTAYVTQFRDGSVKLEQLTSPWSWKRKPRTAKKVEGVGALYHLRGYDSGDVFVWHRLWNNNCFGLKYETIWYDDCAICVLFGDWKNNLSVFS